jgi:hypothetical protein
MPMTNAFRGEIQRVLDAKYAGLKNLDAALSN